MSRSPASFPRCSITIESVTLPPLAPARYGLTALYRRLARLSLFALGVGYTACLTIANVLRGVALRQDWVIAFNWIAPLIAVLGLSLLFTVVTWYRDEDTVTATLVIIIQTTVAIILAMGITDFVFTGSIGALIFGVTGGFLATVVRVVIFFPVIFALVWAGRRLRRFFAPATLTDENLP